MYICSVKSHINIFFLLFITTQAATAHRGIFEGMAELVDAKFRTVIRLSNLNLGSV